MTFLQIQDQIMKRLNLTSSEARARIKDEINDKYRELTSSVNLKRTRFSNVNVAVTGGTPTVTLSNVARLNTLYDPVFLLNTLKQIPLERIREMDAAQSATGIPDHYAIVGHNASSVTIVLYPVPSANNTLKADVLALASDLSADGDVPVFPEDYHDILVDAVLADEYYKLEKDSLGDRAEQRATKRTSDLRYFIAKSAFLHTVPQDRGAPGQLSGDIWPYANIPS